PFITMAYALVDSRNGTMRFARAGHPYPLYVPREGPARFWQIEGSLLGVFESEFRIQTHTLAPGDKVLFYTDGMEAAEAEKQPMGGASFLAAVGKLRHLSIDDLVPRLESELFGQSKRSDDLTILGMEFLGDTPLSPGCKDSNVAIA